MRYYLPIICFVGPVKLVMEAPKQQRRSDRVSISLPIQISGEDGGQAFTEKTKTEIVSRNGAAIVSARPLGPEQVLTIRFGSNERQARVVGQIGIHRAGNVYGVALLGSTENFWGIIFPPLSATGDCVTKLCLECGGCDTREVVALNEMEFAVFEANEQLQRVCGKCQQATVWKAVLHDAPVPRALRAAETAAPPGGSTSLAGPAKPPPSRGPEHRKFARVKVSVPGCVRQDGVENAVEVLDMSRGGVRFRTGTVYAVGSWVQLAAPYTAGSANIFVAGRIVWCRPAANDRKEYGLKYLKN